LDEIVLPYEKIDLTDINFKLSKLESDIKKIPVVPNDLNTLRESVKTNANKVPGLVTDFLELNGEHEERFGDLSAILDPLNFDVIQQLTNDVEQLQQDLENSIDDRRGELDELVGCMIIFEDETVECIKEDIDLLKDEVKKNVTIPSDLNEKWNGLLGAWENLDNFNGEYEERFSDLSVF
jgi:septation ring formation regulator EzrA